MKLAERITGKNIIIAGDEFFNDNEFYLYEDKNLHITGIWEEDKKIFAQLRDVDTGITLFKAEITDVYFWIEYNKNK